MKQQPLTPELIENFVPRDPETVTFHVSREEINEEMAEMLGGIVLTVPRQPRVDATAELFASPASIPMPVRYEYCLGQPFVFAPTSRYVSAADVSRSLDMPFKDLTDVITELNVPYSMLNYDTDDGLLLAPGLKRVIAEELNWRTKYNAADTLLSTTQLAEIVGGLDEMSLKLFLSKTKIGYLEGPQGVHNYPKAIAHQLRAEIMLSAQNLRSDTIQRGPSAYIRNGVDLSLCPNNFDTTLVKDMIEKAHWQLDAATLREDSVLPISELAARLGTTTKVAKEVFRKLGIKPVRLIRPTVENGTPVYTADVISPLAIGVVHHWSSRIKELQQKVTVLGQDRIPGAPTLLLRQYNAANGLLTMARKKHADATSVLQQLRNPDEDISEDKAS